MGWLLYSSLLDSLSVEVQVLVDHLWIKPQREFDHTSTSGLQVVKLAERRETGHGLLARGCSPLQYLVYAPLHVLMLHFSMHLWNLVVSLVQLINGLTLLDLHSLNVRSRLSALYHHLSFARRVEHRCS